jgi:hypothetical protein
MCRMISNELDRILRNYLLNSQLLGLGACDMCHLARRSLNGNAALIDITFLSVIQA